MICAHNIKLTKNKTKIKAKHISFRSPISAAMKIEFASSIILAALCVSHAALRGSSNVESESRRNRRLPHMVTCDGLKAKEQVPCDQYNPDQPNDEYSPTRPMDNQTKTSEAGVNLTPGTSVGNPGSIPTRPKDEYNPTRPIQVSGCFPAVSHWQLNA